MSRCGIPQYLQRHPKFGVLLTDLEDNVLVSCEANISVVKARMEADRAKLNYFKALAVFAEGTELLHGNAAATQMQSCELRRNVFDLAHLSRSLLPTMGVDHVSLYSPSLEESGEKELSSCLESRLSRKCALLVDFLDPQTQKSSGELQTAKGLQLAQAISTKIVKFKSEQQKLVISLMNNTLIFWEYYSVLAKVLSALRSLVTVHKEQQGHAHSLVIAKWLRERLQITNLKLQVLKCQFKDSIYTSGTKHSLDLIGEHLHTRTTHTKQLHDRTLSRYQQFEAVGLGLNLLAREYSAIVKECSHKEWALRELQELGRE